MSLESNQHDEKWAHRSDDGRHLQERYFERVGEVAVPSPDLVNHPPHYNAHPSGVECIQITEHMGFCLGNAVKYIWRADLKGDAVEDLEKARWYIEREIAKREAGQ